jgi:RNA polymerase sigma-70 factor, ECF subfamily
VIERTEANARQLVARARKHLEANRPRFDADEAARDALLERFLAAAEEGDVEGLEELLHRDAVLYADGGGKVMAPAEPLYGARLVAGFVAFITQMRRAFGDFESLPVRVNGQPGVVLRGPGEPGYGDAERGAVAEAVELLKSGVDAMELAARAMRSRDAPVAPAPADPRVWNVLTVDVVDGRIQTVRMVRNPDKLAHL